MKTTLAVGVIVLAATRVFTYAPVQSDATATAREFDVASIKRNLTGSTAWRVWPRPTIRMVNVTLLTLLNQAYPLTADTPIIGLPKWAESEHFDVEARGGADASPEQRQQMWRALLADRMKLMAHYGTREVNGFRLVVARADGRLGVGLTPSALACRPIGRTPAEVAETARRYLASTPPALRPSSPPPSAEALETTLRSCSRLTNGATLVSGAITVDALTEHLSAQAGRPVVDQTRLNGSYAVRLVVDEGESIFTAVAEQLGLKLEPGRVPVQTLVIDHIERASEN